MPLYSIVALVLALALVSYGMIYRRARAFSAGPTSAGRGTHLTVHSRPGYHALSGFLSVLVAGLGLLILWQLLEPQVASWLLAGWMPESYASLTADQQSLLLQQTIDAALSGQLATLDASLQEAAASYADFRGSARWVLSALVAISALVFFRHSLKRVNPAFRARIKVERSVRIVMIASAAIAVITTFGIFFSLIFESLRFFEKVPFFDFVFGLDWSPQTAIRADQVGSSGAFGALPLLGGTLLISIIAMLVAVPVGLFAAIYLSEYASPRVRAFAKPALEILAGIPTVVYGFFAALTVAPFFKGLGAEVGLDVASESALAAGVVMGIMIIPFVSSLSDDVMNAVPQTLRDGSLALGSTKSETIRQVVLPAALPGIVGAILLAASRAIGETMIVVMAAGLTANLTTNPLEAVTTVTVQIKTILVGDQEFDSAKTLSAFALGLLLFVVTLALNFVALRVVRKYREKYD